MIELAGLLGLTPMDMYNVTLPEFLLLLRGWQRANGIDPDEAVNSAPMTMARLKEIIEKDKEYE